MHLDFSECSLDRSMCYLAEIKYIFLLKEVCFCVKMADFP